MNKRNLYSFLAAFLLLIGVIIINWLSFNRMKDYASMVDHTRVVIGSFERVLNNIKSGELYSAKYARTNSNIFYNNYRNELEKITPEINTLRTLIGDNPVQAKRIDTLSRLVNNELPVLREKNIVEIIESGETWRLDNLANINFIIKRGIEDEEGLLNERKANLQKFTNYSSFLTIIFSISAFLLVAITFIFNLSLLRRRKWLEGFLEAILDTSRAGITTYKAVREKGKIIDFKIEFANPAIEELFDVKREDILGKRLLDVPLYAKDTGLLETYIKVTETGEKQELEISYHVREQEEYFLVFLAKLEDGITASFYKITELKKYQHELQATIKTLAESNKQLEQFAYVASHDLQEPLRKIMVFGSHFSTLYKDKLDDRATGLLSKMNQAAERMSKLIYDILNFSSLKKEPVYAPIDLNVVLNTVLEDLELRISQSNATIKKEELPVIEAIPLQMNQLFHNLLSNSLKFAKKDETPVIEIKCKALTSEEVSRYPELSTPSQYIEIIIADNGIGFKGEYAEQIFGMFKRLNDKAAYPGSGIGLALCRKVVVNHNGIITAKSEDGRGASFQIILPQKQAEATNKTIMLDDKVSSR
jgi:signal transduction histidine kinase